MADQPYADLYNALGTVHAAPLRGRLVLERGDVDLDAASPTVSTPWRDLSQREIKRGVLTMALRPEDDEGARIELGEFTCDDEGYLDDTLELSRYGLEPGHYVFEAFLEGEQVGWASARLLAEDHRGLVVRSDIDKTYLDTRFESRREALGLLTQPATRRAVLPAMAEVYRALQRGEEGDADLPMVFLSGSPRFFKRVLEARLLLDGIHQSGLFLKPFKSIAARKLSDFSVRSVIPALKAQVGYKLTWLLIGRFHLPQMVPELLMGDDSEADFVIYNLYARLTSGELAPEALSEALEALRVAEFWRVRIEALAPRLVEWLDGFRPVRAIYINLTGQASGRHETSDWSLPELTRIHEGAWPLILDLREEGLVAAEAVTRVRRRLEELGATEAALEAHARHALEGGVIAAETFDRHHGEPSPQPHP